MSALRCLNMISVPTNYYVQNRVRSLSIVLQDADIASPKQELNSDQKKDLEDIDKGCRNILDELQRIIDENSELSAQSGSVERESQGSGRGLTGSRKTSTGFRDVLVQTWVY